MQHCHIVDSSEPGAYMCEENARGTCVRAVLVTFTTMLSCSGATSWQSRVIKSRTLKYSSGAGFWGTEGGKAPGAARCCCHAERLSLVVPIEDVVA